MAAPGYAPYGNYVWHRDNAECIMALDEYAATFGETYLFEITSKAILRSFLYFESKQKGVIKLCKMKSKLSNPEFYDNSYHPHARLSRNGEELFTPWNSIQYDSVARMVIALSKHLSLTRNVRLFEKCKAGLNVSLQYLFNAIWDESGTKRSLTVSANEWEEKDEPHLRGPLFSSVVGLLNASSRYSRRVLQEYCDLKDFDLADYEKQTDSMLKGFFVRNDTIRMIKRFDESPVGMCASSLWLLTTFDAFSPRGDVFKKTLAALMSNQNLSVELGKRGDASAVHTDPDGGADNSAAGSVRRGPVMLRRYELMTTSERPPEGAIVTTDGLVDSYWGGQAWIITTAQLATALAMSGEVVEAKQTLDACLQARDSEGKLPEQFAGTQYSQSYHDKWRVWSQAQTAAPWLAWSHAEVLRAYSTIYRAS
jgi:hypothetical protein